MFLNNLKISLRILKRNMSFSAINIIGLSTAFAMAVLILMYAYFELSYEKDNPQADQLVRITMDYLNGETVIDQDCETYKPLGPRMVSEFSEVVDFTRAFHINDNTINIGENYFRVSKIFAVDPSFFSLFNHQLLEGNVETVFLSPHEAVLTESLAKLYFDRVDVVGETFWMSSIDKTFKIVGVIADSPPNTHLKINMLLSYPTIEASFDQREDDWANNNALTYLLLSDPNRFHEFNEKLDLFNHRLHEEGKIANERIIGQQIRDIHLYSDKSYEVEKNGDATSVFFLLGIAILVIVVALVNYINLATSKSLDRAKEVGIRKVVGSSLSQLRIQFFTESFLINIFAAFVALGLIVIALGKFKNIAELPDSFTFFQNPIFWFVLCSLFLLSTLLSGIFPAFILSSFKPISVLTGRFSHSSGGVFLRKGLVVFQFSITIFLIVLTLTASEQLRYMRQKDLGINIEQTIVVRSTQVELQNKKHQVLKDKILDYSQFQSVALSSVVPGQPHGEVATTTGINLADAIEKSSFNFYVYWMDADFIPTLQIQLKAGNNFVNESQNENQVIVNEEAIRLWGIPTPEEAIGKKIDMWGSERTIIGVGKNFHQATAKTAHVPMIFLFNPQFYRFVSIRTNPGNINSQLDLIKNIYQSTFPDSPFEYFFLDQEFERLYRDDEKFQQVFGTLTVLAILIACLGLFGLAAFTAKARTKEIGIRKVLGSSVWGIMVLLSENFTKMVLIAVFTSLPISYLIASRWLADFAFHIELEWWFFAGAGLLALIIAWFTVGLQTIKTARINPVDSLRNE